MSVVVCDGLLRYSSSVTEDDVSIGLLHGWILWIANLDVWFETVVKVCKSAVTGSGAPD